MELNNINELTLPKVQKDLLDTFTRWKNYALATCVYIDYDDYIAITYSDHTVSGDIFEAWNDRNILCKIDLKNTDITPEFIQEVVKESIYNYKSKSIKNKLDDIKKDFK